MQKLCKKCNREKSVNDFYNDPRSKDGLRTYCKLCCRNIGQTWIKNNRLAHNTRCNSYAVKHKQEQKRKLVEMVGGKCKLCGYNKCIGALDFHHMDPSKKDVSISTAMSSSYSLKRLIAEADKCVLLCCRCHRELHAGLVSLPL